VSDVARQVCQRIRGALQRFALPLRRSRNPHASVDAPPRADPSARFVPGLVQATYRVRPGDQKCSPRLWQPHCQTNQLHPHHRRTCVHSDERVACAVLVLRVLARCCTGECPWESGTRVPHAADTSCTLACLLGGHSMPPAACRGPCASTPVALPRARRRDDVAELALPEREGCLVKVRLRGDPVRRVCMTQAVGRVPPWACPGRGGGSVSAPCHGKSCLRTICRKRC